MDYFLCVMGMVLIIEGLPYFAIPERMRQWVHMLFEMPDARLRRVGFSMIAIGLMLVYIGRS